MKQTLRATGLTLAAIFVAWFAFAPSPAEAYDYDYGYTSDYGYSDYGGYDYNSGYTYDYGYSGNDYNYGYTYDYGNNGNDYNYGYTYDYGNNGYDYNYDYTYDYGNSYDYNYDYTYDYGNSYDYNYDYNYDYTYDYGNSYDYNYDYTYDYGNSYDYNYDYTYDYGNSYDYNYDYTYDYSGGDYNYDYTYDYSGGDYNYENTYDYDAGDYNYDYAYNYDGGDYSYDAGDYNYDGGNFGGGMYSLSTQGYTPGLTTAYSFGGNSGSSGGCSGSSCYYDDGGCTGSSCDIAYNDIQVECTVSDSTIEEGDCVTYRVSVDGGNSPFDYFWDGDTEGEDGNHSSITVCYDHSGSYRVSVDVEDDDGQNDSDSCPTVVVADSSCTGSSCGCSGSSCPDDHPQVECVVSDSTIEEGDSVTFTANVDGGDSPIDYDWSGDASGTSRTVTKTFSTAGTYDVEVKVTDDDGDTDTDTCQVKVEDHGGCSGSSCDLQVQCEVSDSTIEEGDCVTYEANVDGGDSPFDYLWKGDLEGENDDNNETIRVCYDHSGTYEAEIKVTDDSGDTDTDTCEVKVEDKHDNGDFDVQCEVSDSHIDEGDCVTYSVNIDNGNSPYSYDWNGDLEGENDDEEKTIKVCYDDSGDYEVSIVVEDDDGNRESDTCEVEVDDNGGSSHHSSSYSNNDSSNGTLASIDAVYLSQIPYTGPEETAALVATGIAVVGLGFGAAVSLKKRSIRKQNSDRVAAFKEANLAKKSA